jgi:ribosomal protein L27
MGGRVGGITSKFYCETAGIKVSGGQKVKSGTILTRQGDKWKCGLNVIGRSSLTAVCDGEVYFTRRKNSSKKVITLVNIKPSN